MASPAYLKPIQLQGQVGRSPGVSGPSTNVQYGEWQPFTWLPIEVNSETKAVRPALPLALQNAFSNALSATGAPAKALGGGYDLMIDPATGVNYYDGMAEDAAGLAGMVTLGAGAVPGQGLRMGAASGRPTTVRLYHGTTDEGAEGIRASGRIRGPAFLTPSRNTARRYAEDNGGSDDTVIAVDVPVDELMIDLDMPGARLLSVEDAATYLGREDLKTAQDFIDAGYSVGVRHGVTVNR